MFEFPSWLIWLAVGWLLASVCFTAAVARWFRWLKD